MASGNAQCNTAMFSFVREEFYGKFQENIYVKPEESLEDRFFFVVN